jgi:hypothetical protein
VTPAACVVAIYSASSSWIVEGDGAIIYTARHNIPSRPRLDTLPSSRLEPGIQGAAMTRYYFTIRAGENGGINVQTVGLQGDAAAFDHAVDLAHAATRDRDRSDLSWLVKVSDDTRPIVFVLPILAACA